MKYADLIERALSEVKGSDASLAALLDGVDALNKSVPTLEELNQAFSEIERRGRFPAFNWSPVAKEAYDSALAQNLEHMVQALEGQGMSRERQRQALELHQKVWRKT